MNLPNPIPFRVRIERVGANRSERNQGIGRNRTIAALVGAAALLPMVLVALPADAASSGSNGATVNLTPAAVRSLTVTPATSTFGNCSGGNASELAFPNGLCSVGTFSTSPVTGGVTVTNGSTAGHIDVSGGNAVPADHGTPWSLVTLQVLPGTDQFLEVTESAAPGTGQTTLVVPTASCDVAFDVGLDGCAATSGQSTEEELAINGPSTSSDAGPFTITTTWTAVP
jgi:hypothetical protein